jgi:hypothetical protein
VLNWRGGRKIEWRDNVMIVDKLRNSETNMLCCLLKVSRPFLGPTQPQVGTEACFSGV